MNEVEKLYEITGIGKQKYYVMQDENYKDVFEIKYPPFTPEKQLELIKWLAVKGDFDCTVDIAKNTDAYWTIYFDDSRWTADGFEETLAGLINNLWQDLTEEEREQIKNILESEVRE